MVELLAVEKKRLLAERGYVTSQDFSVAWDECWWTMKLERAWPHATVHRRGWRRAQERTRREMRAAFLDEPTPFALAAERLSEAAAGMCLHLEPEQVGKALLAAMAYVQIDDEDVAVRASTAAHAFVSLPPTARDQVAA